MSSASWPSMNVPSRNPEVDVDRAEGELSALESQLSLEGGRLQESAKDLSGRLQQLRAQAAQLQLQSGEAVAKRLSTVAIPSLDVRRPLEEARAARVAAVQTRSRAVEEARSLISVFAADLSRISSVLAAETQELAAAQERQRQEQQQAKARALREAMSVPPFLSPKGSQAAKAVAGPEGLSRRGQGRVKMQAAIDLRSDSNFFTGFSTNLSEGGVFVATVNLLPLGSEVDLRFTLPSGQAIDVHGVVRWMREINDRTPEVFPGMGVQFQSLNEPAVHAIRAFVATREPLFFPD